ncbi:FadR/GntR family transcriptional regulator [Rhodococcoides yunnanense]|uniref:FadR/GntR family transcriptional regulator n=1 Tax=Rhodococcoides yunnanense TaxID=278209 RepID=UPI0009354B22|nr:FadR/GntR family transcriptional regulator [Rhodococcus yunnanensis]
MENPRPRFEPAVLTRRDASGQIASQIRRGIVDGVWLPGERLPTEMELAEAFDVARPTAREAVKLLGATGMVASTRGAGGGTYVTSPHTDLVRDQLSDSMRLWYRSGDVSVREVDEARRILELQCIELAAERRTTLDLHAIRTPVELSRDPALTWGEFLDLDIDFHTAITRAARNRILELAMTSIHLSRPATNTVFLEHLERERVIDQHSDIYDAIASGDVTAALRAFTTHVDYLDAVRDRAFAAVDLGDVPVNVLGLEP